MTEIINLRQVRKNKKREEKAQKAHQNRLSYGRKKEEKLLSIQEKINAEKELDGKKLDQE